MSATCQTPNSSHLSRVSYLVGYPIAHSLAPLLHQVVYDSLSLPWAQLPLPTTDLTHFVDLMRNDPKFYGASVTMPHKIDIVQYLDELDDVAKVVGAVNTIFLQEAKDGTKGEQTVLKRVYVGTNTDVVGVREAFLQNVADPDKVIYGKPGMVIGGGGTTRSAVYALWKWLQCTPIYLVNRDKSEVDAVMKQCAESNFGGHLVHLESVEQADGLEEPGAVVSCVPNFSPRTPEEITARNIVTAALSKPRKGALLEMCYHPTPQTEIGELAKKLGWQVILGTEAMIWQGVEQDKYWTGRPIKELPVDKVKAAIADALDHGSRITV